MKRLLLAILVLWPIVASAQSLQRLPGFRLCEPGATGSDCVTVGPMGAVTGAPACIPQSDSTPFDTCVTVSAAPTAAPTVTPIPTPTPYAAYDTIEEEGVPLTKRRNLNVVGAYVTCADADPDTTCTVVTPTPQPTATPGAGGSTLPVVDTTSIVEGSADATKEIRFEVDGLTTGTVRVLTPQNADYTIAGTTVALGGTGLTSGTSGGILGFTGSTTLASSAALADNTILLGGGAGAVPTSHANLTFNDSTFRLRGQNLTTADDNATNMVQFAGVMPTTPSASVEGITFDVTGAGSASFNNDALSVDYAAGYTGPNANRAAVFINRNSGTGASLSLNTAGPPTANTGDVSLVLKTGGVAAGYSVASYAEPRDSSGVMIGHMAKAVDNEAGTNIGTLGNAANSTEATDFKNIGGYFGTDPTLITGANISVALLAQGDGTDDIFRGYADTTLIFRAEDSGEFTSAGTTSIGWSKQAATNQACNTTCTSACVAGFDLVAGLLACSDATADQCLCAGSS